jgi:Fic family protein
MKWNWQQPDWPAFSWKAACLSRAEEHFLLDAGRLIGVVEHLAESERDVLRVQTLGDEAVTTSEIEGEVLSRESVQSSIRRQLGLQAEPRRVSPAEQGIGELMVDLYRRFDAPLDAATLYDWHRMVVRGRADLHVVGGYRTHAEPMQIVSGRLHDPRVHFEAPSSGRVPAEMERFLEWFARTGPSGSMPLPPLTRAGVAHLYFESIHPFEDGNGRVGRAVAEKALAQGLGRPSLTAIAATILARRSSYYEALEAANRSNEITAWLAWFAGMVLEAQARTLSQVEFLIEKTRLLDRLRGRLNERQSAVLLRVLREGPKGFEGGLSAGNYVSIAKTSPATAGRDLAAMVDMGALTRTGEKRHTRYHLPFAARPLPRITVAHDGRLEVHLGHAPG